MFSDETIIPEYRIPMMTSPAMLAQILLISRTIPPVNLDLTVSFARV